MFAEAVTKYEYSGVNFGLLDNQFACTLVSSGLRFVLLKTTCDLVPKC
jgi:hypothetical protein